MTAARMPISGLRVIPRPNSATARGRPTATIKPNAISRTIAAPEEAEQAGAALRVLDRPAARPRGRCRWSCWRARSGLCPSVWGRPMALSVASRLVPRRSCRRARGASGRAGRRRSAARLGQGNRQSAGLWPGCWHRRQRAGTGHQPCCRFREALSDRRARCLRVRAGCRVSVKLALEGVAHGKDHDQDNDPSEDHRFPAPGSCRRDGRSVRSWVHPSSDLVRALRFLTSFSGAAELIAEPVVTLAARSQELSSPNVLDQPTRAGPFWAGSACHRVRSLSLDSEPSGRARRIGDGREPPVALRVDLERRAIGNRNLRDGDLLDLPCA